MLRESFGDSKPTTLIGEILPWLVFDWLLGGTPMLVVKRNFAHVLVGGNCLPAIFIGSWSVVVQCLCVALFQGQRLLVSEVRGTTCLCSFIPVLVGSLLDIAAYEQ